jgi:5-bromo-4-chloroindolyl phosphate hydrolysis protein
MNKKTFRNFLSNVYSALIGGGVFVVTYFLLKMGFIVALVFTVAGYAAAIFLVFPSKKEEKAAELEDTLRVVLKEGEEKLKLMRSLGYQVKNNIMQLKINEMYDIGHQIFEIVKKDPKNVRSVQQFSSYYLDTTIKIIKKYIELSKHTSYSTEVKNAVEKVESTLNQVKRVFEKQLEHLVQDDVLDLDMEMSVLEETLELEGLEVNHEE